MGEPCCFQSRLCEGFYAALSTLFNEYNAWRTSFRGHLGGVLCGAGLAYLFGPRLLPERKGMRQKYVNQPRVSLGI